MPSALNAHPERAGQADAQTVSDKRAFHCPHCRGALLEARQAGVGRLHECASCGGLSFTLEAGRRPVALLQRESGRRTLAELPAPAADGTIRVEGLWLDGSLDLAELSLQHPLELHRCVIAPPPGAATTGQQAALTLRGSRLAGRLTLTDTLLFGSLDLHDAYLADSLTLRHLHVAGECDASGLLVEGGASAWNLVCAEQANFHQARFAGDAALRGCSFAGETNFNDVLFGGEGNLSESSFSGSCDFSGSEFASGAEFHSARFARPVEFSDLSVFAWADFTACVFTEHADFRGAIFHSGAEFDNATFEGGADFSRVRFDGDVTFSHARAHAGVNFADARFGGKADLRHARLLADADFYRARFADSAFLQGVRLAGRVRLSEAGVAGELRLDHARLQLPEEEPPASATRSAVTGEGTGGAGGMDMRGLHVGGEFVLDGAHVGATLWLDRLDLDDGLSLQRAHFHGEVSLEHGVVAGAVRANETTFRAPVRISNSKLGSGILARHMRVEELWEMRDTLVSGPSSFSHSQFRGRNAFEHTEFRGRFDITNASFTEKLDLSLVTFDANLMLDGLRAELLIIQRHQVEGRLESEVYARSGPSEDGQYWRVLAREYAVLKRSFRMQGQYVDMDWAHHRYSQADRKARTYEAFNPDLEKLKRGTARRGWLGYLFERSLRNPFEKVFVDWTSGYGTRPLRVLATMLFSAVLFMPAYLGMEQRMLTAEPEETNRLTVIDAYFVALGAQFAVGVDRIVVLPELWRRVWGMTGVFVGLGLLTLFISTLSRKMIQ